jgi:hypothetical protein
VAAVARSCTLCRVPVYFHALPRSLVTADVVSSALRSTCEVRVVWLLCPPGWRRSQ